MARSDQIRKLLSKVAGIAVLLAGALLAASLCFGAPDNPSQVPSIFDPRSTPTKSIYHLSVSYTHLDVYKRQPFVCAFALWI